MKFNLSFNVRYLSRSLAVTLFLVGMVPLAFAEGAIKTIKAEQFKAEVLDSKVPVLVDFFAQWCGPCKRLSPILEELAKEYEGKFKFIKMDEADSSKFFREQGVTAYPTLRFYQDGAVSGEVLGFRNKDAMKSLIDLFKAPQEVGLRFAGMGLYGQEDNLKSTIDGAGNLPVVVMIGDTFPDLPLMQFSYEFNKVARIVFVVHHWNPNLAKTYGIEFNQDKKAFPQGLYKFEKGKEIERFVFFEDSQKEFEKKLEDYRQSLKPALEEYKRAQEEKKKAEELQKAE